MISLSYRPTTFHCYTGQQHSTVTQVNSIPLSYRPTTFHCHTGQQHSIVIQVNSIPLSYRPTAFHCHTVNSIPLSYSQQHSTVIQSTAFHCHTGQQHSIVIQVNNILLSYNQQHFTAIWSTGFHCYTGQQHFIVTLDQDGENLQTVCTYPQMKHCRMEENRDWYCGFLLSLYSSGKSWAYLKTQTSQELSMVTTTSVSTKDIWEFKILGMITCMHVLCLQC